MDQASEAPPTEVEPALSLELHTLVRELVAFLSATAMSEEFGAVPDMREALTFVLEAARDLDAAVLPAASSELPTDAELGWTERHPESASCPIGPRLPLEPARRLVGECMAWSRRFEAVLQRLQFDDSARRAPKSLVLRFAFVMGYLYTDVCRPLQRQHPELADRSLAD